jgi:ABC-2 type transport system ATP-binding protein
MSEENVIEVRNLSKVFGKFTAVDHISFDVKKGEIFGFLGANGAGKTTAIKMLTGILSSSSGEATVAGFDINKNRNKLKENIGYMSQKFSLYEDLTLKENIAFYGGIYGLSKTQIKEKTAQMVNELGLENIEDTLIAEIPLGWKQKIAFSVAILHKPKIVFLDEPTSGVDPITRRQFWSLIYKAAADGITVFVTTHYMDEAEYCDRISMMVEGRIEALGSLQELLTKYDSQNMDQVFIKLARATN